MSVPLCMECARESACVEKAFSSSERCEFRITDTGIEIGGERRRERDREREREKK